MPPKLPRHYDDILRRQRRFLQVLRASLVIAGADEMDDNRLMDMTVGDILQITFRNNITLEASLDNLRRP